MWLFQLIESNLKDVANNTDCKLDYGSIEHSASESNALCQNKVMHTLQGNKKHYKILQLNSSNADFNSKLHELRSTINFNEADIVIISESNFEHQIPRPGSWQPEFPLERRLLPHQVSSTGSYTSDHF